jgi:antitoxin component of RelBE/YafQ-DinJ toxin-antitoxin module
MIKKENVLLRIDSELKEKSKFLAEKRGLSLSCLIRLILIKEIENE